jgi:5-methylcytosine-specific restriction endonuclease McrA
MPFPESVKDEAFKRAGGRCECKRSGHPHIGRCMIRLTPSTAQLHHITAQAVGGDDGISNCEVLCAHCHRLTDSYGRH